MKGTRDEFGIPYGHDLPDVEPCDECARYVVEGCVCVCKTRVLPSEGSVA